MAEPIDELLLRPPEERERRMKMLENGTAEIVDGDEVRRDGILYCVLFTTSDRA
jgi:hypothetical protein